MREIIANIKKSILYQHKSLTKALEGCKISQTDKRFILILNRMNTRTNLIYLKILEKGETARRIKKELKEMINH